MQICYTLTVRNIDPATAAHIHEAPAGVAGDVRVTLEAPTDGSSERCASVSRELALEIIQNPEDSYVNVHNAPYRAGVVLRQLGKQ